MTCKKECMEQKKDGTLKDCPIIKENEQLKEQIEKMKCCMNCVHCEINQEWHLFCNADSVINFNANFCEKWELSE